MRTEQVSYIPRLIGFFSEHSDQEFTFLLGLKGGWNNGVGTWCQLVAATYLSHVDKGRGLGNRCIVFEELNVKGASVGVIQLNTNVKKTDALGKKFGWPIS